MVNGSIRFSECQLAPGYVDYPFAILCRVPVPLITRPEPGITLKNLTNCHYCGIVEEVVDSLQFPTGDVQHEFPRPWMPKLHNLVLEKGGYPWLTQIRL